MAWSEEGAAIFQLLSASLDPMDEMDVWPDQVLSLNCGLPHKSVRIVKLEVSDFHAFGI